MKLSPQRGIERTKALGRWGLQMALAAVFSLPCLGQFTPPYVGVTGTMGSANGMPASNYVVTFTPSQAMYVGGTSVIVGNANCATDTNGAIVGTGNPTSAAVLHAVTGTGSLGPANYYVEITWYDAAAHQTLGSPETQIQLTATGSIQVSPPVTGAGLSAVGMNVYIGTSSGAETYQGQVTNPASTYTQSTALVTGAALPTYNNTVCVTVANDAAWPIGGYTMNVTTPAGNTVPGFPQLVQFVGPGSSYNLTNGIPAWNGRVTYPVPLLSLPYNHNTQSVSGPLSMTNYSITSIGRLGVGTAVPAFGLDVQGTGALAAVNAAQGFTVNGLAGTTGQALCSDGTYFDTACSFTWYYQTILNSAGTATAQQTYLKFAADLSVTNVTGPPAVTLIDTVGFTGSKVAGSCTLTISNGLITAVSGC